MVSYSLKDHVWLPRLSLSSLTDMVKVKGKFLYSTVSSPQDCSKRFTSLADLFSQIHLNFFGKHPATLRLMCKGCLLQISTIVYNQVLIHIAEWPGAIYSEQNLSKNLTPQHRIKTKSTKLYPWATALDIVVGSCLFQLPNCVCLSTQCVERTMSQEHSLQIS